MYYAKQVYIGGKGYSLASMELDATVTSASFTGTGTITVLGGILTGQISATVNWKNDSFTGSGQLTIANLTTIQGKFTIDRQLNLTLTASNTIDFSKFGLNITASANIMLQYLNDSTADNDFYAAWTVQKFFDQEVVIGVRFNLDGSWSLLGAGEITEITGENDTETTEPQLLKYSLRRSAEPVTRSWDLSGIDGVVLLCASWIGESGEVALTDADGNIYTIEDVSGLENITVVESMSSDNSVTFAINDPADGKWSLSVANADDVTFNAKELSSTASASAPVVTAVLSGDDRVISLEWTCDKLPENAEIAIYCDTDDSSYDGILVTSQKGIANGSFQWEVPENSSGDLYFYATVTLPDNLPVIGEYSEVVSIEAVKTAFTVNPYSWNFVNEDHFVIDAEIWKNGILEISGGEVRGNTRISAGAYFIADNAGISGNILLAGSLTLNSESTAGDDTVITIDLKGKETGNPPAIENLDLLKGNFTLAVMLPTDQKDAGYLLASNAADFNGSVTVIVEDSGDVSLTLNNAAEYNGQWYCLSKNAGDLILKTADSKADLFDPELNGNKNRLAWDDILTLSGKYDLCLSNESDFDNSFYFQTGGKRVDLIAVKPGNYYWQIKGEEEETWYRGNMITVTAEQGSSQLFKSAGNGCLDLFIVTSSGKWSKGYAAEHRGYGSWAGTGEHIDLAGKNKIADIFEGSDDANILILTDDDNGDALFVDDIYTALPLTISQQQSRIAQINEIRAGAGDDIVDLTSQQFSYTGDNLTIYGGAGNDTLWANKGSNTLFGGSGNDRLVGGSGDDTICGGNGNDSMHGGGGNDIFTFGENWGVDTIGQLDNGTVTLRFESGTEDNWDKDSLTYTDGENRVTVKGVSADKITLIFGGDISTLPDGCFAGAIAENIFEKEDKNNGTLAS